MNAPLVIPVNATLYRCCEDWEHSQYDDSDFYCVAYNPETDSLHRIQTYTTRYACGHRTGLAAMTPEMLPRAVAALARLYEASLTHEEKMRAEQPTIVTLTRGTAVRFLAAHRCMVKDAARVEVECPKCQGRGKWINPRNAADERPCFACDGSGKAKRTVRTRAKGADGKQAWHEIPEGTAAEVLGQATFGTFFRKGYNQPDRSNTTVYLRLADGTEVQAPAAKLRLAAEPPTARAIQATAEHMAEQGPGAFYYPFRTAGRSML